MTFEQYHKELISRAGELEHATKKYIRILFSYGYSLKQAEHTLITN